MIMMMTMMYVSDDWMMTMMSLCVIRRLDDDKGRTHELSQSAVKCMRGILVCWLMQADKVECFKHGQTTKNALHSKFDLHTGDPIGKDDDFEHLQVGGG